MPAPMKMGLSNLPSTFFGKGPDTVSTTGLATSATPWTQTLVVPTLANIQSLLTSASSNGCVLCLNLAGGRNNWTDPSGSFLIFNPTKFEAQIRRWTVAGGASSAVENAIKAAILIPTCIFMTVDEPQHPVFNNSISREQRNAMGLLIKECFPGALTMERSKASLMATTPTGGWTGLDYGCSAYVNPIVRGYGPAASWFASEKTALAAVGLGMTAADNWLDGGDGRMWDYLNTGSSSGRIAGQSGSANQWMCSPAELREHIDAIFSDPDVPTFHSWTYVYDSFTPFEPFRTYQHRSDYVSAFNYMITKAASRPTFNGWRPAKGITAPSTGGGPIAKAYVEDTTRRTMALSAYTDIVGASISSGSLTAGKTYLVSAMVQADFGSTADNASLRTRHGTTVFPGSEVCWQPGGTAGNVREPYWFWTVWTAVAGEAITVQGTNEVGKTFTLGTDQVAMVAFELPAGSYQYNENTTAATLSNAGESTGATKTFTPLVNNQDWAFLTLAQYSGVSTTMSITSRLSHSLLGAGVAPSVQQEGEDAALDRLIHTTAWAATTPSSPVTISEMSGVTGAFSPTRLHSQVLALNMNAFTAHAFAATSAELDYATQTSDYGTQAQTASLVLAAGTDAWILGFHVMHHTSQGIGHKLRLQVNNVDQPPTQTADSANLMYSWDPTDLLPVAVQTVETLGVGTHTLDLDGSLANTTAGAGKGASHRVIIAMTMSTPGADIGPVAPVLAAIGNKAATQNALLSFSISATDGNVGDVITYSILPGQTPVPAGIVLNASTGAFTWTPTRDQVGTWNVLFRATDNSLNPGHLFDEERITITVAADPTDPGPELPPVTPPIATGAEVAARAAADLAAAKELAALLDQQEQMNANVIDKVRSLVTDLTISASYMADVLANQPPVDPGIGG